YVDGINEYISESERGEVPVPSGFAELGLKGPRDWKPTDVVAAVSTIRALFGAGGGSEMNDAAVLAGLVKDFGAKEGRAVYEDFRNRNNSDGPVHTVHRFPYLQRDERKLDPRSNAVEGASSAEVRQLAERSRIKTERLK